MFKAKNLDAIIGSFKKTKDDLEEFIKCTQGERTRKNSEIMSLQAEVTVLELEEKKAEKIKDNINKLIGE